MIVDGVRSEATHRFDRRGTLPVTQGSLFESLTEANSALTSMHAYAIVFGVARVRP